MHCQRMKQLHKVPLLIAIICRKAEGAQTKAGPANGTRHNGHRKYTQVAHSFITALLTR